MLAQLLEFKGQPAIAASQVSLAGEMLELVRKHDAGVVCVGTAACVLAHSRYLCKRLHTRFPELASLVGLWTSVSDPRKSLECLACDGPAHVVTSVGAALDRIHQMVQPLLLQRASAGPSPGPAAATAPTIATE